MANSQALLAAIAALLAILSNNMLEYTLIWQILPTSEPEPQCHSMRST
jgi:hypothetical protein